MFKPSVEIIIDEVPKRKRHKIVELNGNFNRLPTLYDLETVSGKVLINLGNKKSYEHKGIKLELNGIIQGKDSKDTFRFISLTQELESVGSLGAEVNTYPFKFLNVQKQFESYRGFLKNIKYILKLTIDTKLKTHTYEQEFAVINPEPAKILENDNLPIKLDVGIEDWLEITFDVDRRNFSLKDVIVGRVTFRKVSLRLETMEILIIKKEIAKNGAQREEVVICEYEIMDGSPIKNETIPIRMFIKPYDLSPTMANVNNKFSVQYFLKLVLTDCDGKKFFKQSEIFLHRVIKEKKNKAQIFPSAETENSNQQQNLIEESNPSNEEEKTKE